MKTSRHLILYSLLRIGLFAIVFTVLMLLQLWPWVAALAAAIISLCVSYIFFRAPREALAQSLARARASEPRDDDSDAENAALDRAQESAAGTPVGVPGESERERSAEPQSEDEGRNTR